MVTRAQVQHSNAALTAQTAPRTAVFFGGTSGIGKLTLIELVSLGHPIRVYIAGRKATEPAMRPVLEDLRRKNPRAELVWVEAEVSLLAETRRVCEVVKEKETSLIFLCLTAGYAPFGGRNDTSEGIDVCHSLEYYSRMLATLHLLPLLRASASASTSTSSSPGPTPRVLTVLAGSMLSTRIDATDLNLTRSSPSSGSSRLFGFKTQTHMAIMNTLFLDTLAADPANAGVGFVHNWPGAVDTGNMARYHTPTWWSPFPLTNLLRPLFLVMGFEEREAGERHVYLGTSGRFGGRNEQKEGEGEKGCKNTRGEEGRNGLFLVNHKGEVSYSESALEALRGDVQGKVWDLTMEILGPFL
ncbi:hypothetical protein BDP81DRAFT_338542 [Colletotrichum phormii]|uniref:Uncharacterized protein n=1 Tax=Colletotrichum phormii TaxID=359342 RepID=A0AAJ0EP98_9PEZI|nr:uncharacterized protein BDP81DRAFT_338542 [Colletotrichum phormii]KAK1656253.1 hypothetical protein BDP81DRAFT_338542 [Colletotrichum phormii]